MQPEQLQQGCDLRRGGERGADPRRDGEVCEEPHHLDQLVRTLRPPRTPRPAAAAALGRGRRTLRVAGRGVAGRGVTGRGVSFLCEGGDEGGGACVEEAEQLRRGGVGHGDAARLVVGGEVSEDEAAADEEGRAVLVTRQELCDGEPRG